MKNSGESNPNFIALDSADFVCLQSTFLMEGSNNEEEVTKLMDESRDQKQSTPARPGKQRHAN